MSEAASEDFGDLKFTEWENFCQSIKDHLQQIKDEVTTLISSSSAFLKEDKSESQIEIIKVAAEAKKLRTDIDFTAKEMQAYARTRLSLSDIVAAHLKMATQEI